MRDTEIKGAIDKAVRRILSHPYGVVCKHWMVAALCSELENAGYPQPDEFVKAVVKSDDETALTFNTIFEAQRNLGRPRIEDAANSFEATKPWLALGWSRSTWYRRQAEKRKEAL